LRQATELPERREGARDSARSPVIRYRVPKATLDPEPTPCTDTKRQIFIHAMKSDTRPPMTLDNAGRARVRLIDLVHWYGPTKRSISQSISLFLESPDGDLIAGRWRTSRVVAAMG